MKKENLAFSMCFVTYECFLSDKVAGTFLQCIMVGRIGDEERNFEETQASVMYCFHDFRHFRWFQLCMKAHWLGDLKTILLN